MYFAHPHNTYQTNKLTPQEINSSFFSSLLSVYHSLKLFHQAVRNCTVCDHKILQSDQSSSPFGKKSKPEQGNKENQQTKAERNIYSALPQTEGKRGRQCKYVRTYACAYACAYVHVYVRMYAANQISKKNGESEKCENVKMYQKFH